MKRILIVSVLIVTLVLLLVACSMPTQLNTEGTKQNGPAADAGIPPVENETQEHFLYRGIVTEIEPSSFTVEQVNGYDYGEPKVVFHATEQTVFETDGLELQAGNYVEVQYGGAMTFSIPPQATAEKVTIISPFGEDVVLNGTIVSVETDPNGDYRIEVAPFTDSMDEIDVETGNLGNVILLVPVDTLENMKEQDLAEGLNISAITRGIAAASIPPQYPVFRLLPFTGSLIVE